MSQRPPRHGGPKPLSPLRLSVLRELARVWATDAFFATRITFPALWRLTGSTMSRHAARSHVDALVDAGYLTTSLRVTDIGRAALDAAASQSAQEG